MTMPGSCSSGFRSRPSAGAGKSLSKGFDVARMKSRKPKASQPITARMRAVTGSGRCLLKLATAKDQKVSISSQSRIEPSWPPQTAVMR